MEEYQFDQHQSNTLEIKKINTMPNEMSATLVELFWLLDDVTLDASIN